ncbi:MAG: helix-turn-helix transcriptional regulator [Clostridia bacterium]|nr:helix-turn-helix transcriptional regulator [Clostridia bacterium]
MLTEHGIHKAASDILPLFDIAFSSLQKNVTSPISFRASEYLFLYLLKGNGKLSLYNKSYSISSGDFIICRPFESKIFYPENSEETDFYAISFQGRYATDLLSNLNLIPKKNYFVGRDAEIISVLDKILEETERNEASAKLIGSSLFIAILGSLSRLAVSAYPRSTEKEFEKIAPALSSINSDCTSTISVDDYAKMCNLSTSYFTHLFTKVTGFSPMEYKQLQRMSVAKNLLSTTTMTIKEISNIVGFKDPLYFGRCFKQATGQTPSGYRNKK